MMADEVEFTINKAYAEKYNRWRGKEELQKLKDRYGDIDADASSSSSSDTEDEDAEALTASLERDWLRALAAIKSKDPKIYDPTVAFYHSEASDDETSSGSNEKPLKKKKPMFLKDYDRKIILEKGGVLSDDGTSDSEEEKQNFDPSYFEEQENIKQSIKAALPESDSDEDFLTRRVKCQEEAEKEEHEYLEWLKGQRTDLTTEKEVGIELKPLKTYWQDPSLGDDEKFLRDYILNKEFLDEDEDRIPTYNEIVEDQMSEEDKEIEKQEDFERKYNFRFEEPDPEFIKSYPRTMGDSVRRKKDKRAKKRAEVKERKQKEKKKKMEELKQLKNLKKKEIISKIDRLREVTGDPNLALTENDIEEDFDPKEHDRLMEHMFNDDYYDNDEDGTKPVFSDNEELDIDESWDKWQGQASQEQKADAEGHNGDSEGKDDHTENLVEEPRPGTSQEDRSFGLDGRSKKRKKSKFIQALERRKPLFNPEEKTFEEYFDEYYKLDYEDIIGDQPCRFKYRTVPANDFGLTADEVLSCPDRELNAWVSLRKMSQYITLEEEEFEKRSYQRKAKNDVNKQRILPSLTAEDEDDEEAEEEAQMKPKKKRKRKRKKAQHDTEDIEMIPSSQVNHKSDSKKKRNLPDKASSIATETVSEGLVSKKGKGKQKDTEQKPKAHGGDSKRTASSSDRKPAAKRKSLGADRNSTDKDSPKKNKKNKKNKQKKPAAAATEKGFHVSAERLKAYGIDPKKFRYSQINKLDPDGSKSS